MSTKQQSSNVNNAVIDACDNKSLLFAVVKPHG